MRKSLLTISIFLTIFLSTQSFIVFSETQSNIGSYFLFGEYNDEEILWRCIEEDEEKLLLFSDKVLCDKPFDVPGTNTEGSHSRGQKCSDYGSNFWEDSNIRAWLNSDKPYNETIYPCGNPPGAEYNSEAGFLSNFTDTEKNLIQSVNQKSILHKDEYPDMSLYGTEVYKSNETNFASVIQNYDTAYGHMVLDRVFLLDTKQVVSAYELYKKFDDTFWLRTPHANLTYKTNVRLVDQSSVSRDNANQFKGIRPALYIPKNGIIKIGSGTKDNPYKVASVNVSENLVTATVSIPKYSGEGYVIATINSEPNKIGEISMANITFDSEKRIDKEIKFENVTPKPGDVLNIFIWDTNMKPVTEKFTYTFH